MTNTSGIREANPAPVLVAQGKLFEFFQKISLKVILQGMVFVVILTYLGVKLTMIGWAEIAGSLPTSVWFYVLSIGFVFAPVVAELLAFRLISGRKVFRHVRLFLRKHVLNKAVMIYAGEAYLIQRLAAVECLGLRRSAVMVKDMALVRTFVANLWIALLILAAILMGDLAVLQKIAEVSPSLVFVVAGLTLSVCVGGIIWFRRLTRLSPEIASQVAMVFLGRSLFIAVVLITQWSLALPGQSLADWFVFLLFYSVAKKSPIGGDLVFASVVITLPGLAGDPASVAAMLLSMFAVTQVVYFVGFLVSVDKPIASSSSRAPVGHVQPA